MARFCVLSYNQSNLQISTKAFLDEIHEHDAQLRSSYINELTQCWGVDIINNGNSMVNHWGVQCLLSVIRLVHPNNDKGDGISLVS